MKCSTALFSLQRFAHRYILPVWGKKILQGDNTYFHQCVNYYLEHSLLTVFGGCLSLVKQNLTALGLSVCLCEVGGNAFVDI